MLHNNDPNPRIVDMLTKLAGKFEDERTDLEKERATRADCVDLGGASGTLIGRT